MGAIVIRTRYDEGTESAEVATSVLSSSHFYLLCLIFVLLFLFVIFNFVVER